MFLFAFSDSPRYSSSYTAQTNERTRTEKEKKLQLVAAFDSFKLEIVSHSFTRSVCKISGLQFSFDYTIGSGSRAKGNDNEKNRRSDSNGR